MEHKRKNLTNKFKFCIMSKLTTQNGVSFGKSIGRAHRIKNAG